MPEHGFELTSSFTIIKGTLIDETYAVFRNWDLSRTKRENLRRVKEGNSIGAGSANWLRDVAKVLNRRFDPAGDDRSLVELAQNGCDLEIWKPLLLWHMTRREFLVRDFLIHWLFCRYEEGGYRIRTEDLLPYLGSLPSKGVTSTAKWTSSTLSRVASGLLRIAEDFGLVRGKTVREFALYHLPEESFLYLVYAVSEREANAGRIVHSPDWRMYLMHPDDVERELFRLHQYRRLHYEVAGSLAQLSLPFPSARDYAREMSS